MTQNRTMPRHGSSSPRGQKPPAIPLDAIGFWFAVGETYESAGSLHSRRHSHSKGSVMPQTAHQRSLSSEARVHPASKDRSHRPAQLSPGYSSAILWHDPWYIGLDTRP